MFKFHLFDLYFEKWAKEASNKIVCVPLLPPAFGAVARFAVTEEAKNTKEASIIIDTYKVDIKNRDDFSSLFFVLQ